MTRPNAQLSEADIEQIWIRVQRIRNGNLSKDSQGKIGIDFNVSKKTISRIALKETWRDITDRLETQEERRHIDVGFIATLPSIPTSLGDLLDSLVAIKNDWCLSFDFPLSWGWYDAWDGVHGVATDGIIMWRDPRLVAFAQTLAASGVNEPPILAGGAHELPTFDLIEIMERPLMAPYKVGESFNVGITSLLTEKNEVVCVQSKFVSLAERHKCQFYQAGSERHYVYLAKAASIRSDPVLLAAIAIME